MVAVVGAGLAGDRHAETTCHRSTSQGGRGKAGSYDGLVLPLPGRGGSTSGCPFCSSHSMIVFCRT